MKIEKHDDTLKVSEVRELGAANAARFRDEVKAAAEGGPANIDIDLSETTFLDSSGLGALVSLRRNSLAREGAVRLLNPPPPVEQILQLTRMHHVFEIVKS
jgi:anti-sigma B factor antagonist